MKETAYYHKKIMIVDDDSDIVISLQKLFENQGFEVIAVDNGRKCLLELEKDLFEELRRDLFLAGNQTDGNWATVVRHGQIYDRAQTVSSLAGDSHTG